MPAHHSCCSTSEGGGGGVTGVRGKVGEGYVLMEDEGGRRGKEEEGGHMGRRMKSSIGVCLKSVTAP